MSITDELRECIATAIWQYENGIKTAYIPNDKLLAIADRIEEQHRAALGRNAAMVDDEIVQCGDCRWRKGVVCGYFDKITWVMDFCSHGTRRTE